MSKEYIARFLARAHTTLEAHSRLGLASLPAGATQFDATNFVLRLPAETLSTSLSPAKLSSVKHLAVTVCGSYRSGKGYAKASSEWLMSLTALSGNVYERTLKMMCEIGLWGKVDGIGRTPTHYYALFTEDGYAAFIDLVEKAKSGTHPLFGSVADSNGDSEQEPASNPLEAPESGSEAPAVDGEDAAESEYDFAPEYSDDDELITSSPPLEASEEEPREANASGVTAGGLPSGTVVERIYVESL